MRGRAGWMALAAVGVLGLGAAAPALGDDRTVQLAVASYRDDLAKAAKAPSACKGTTVKARACRAAAGRRLVSITGTAGDAARRAATSGAGECVRGGLSTYQRGLNQYAAVGRALRKGQVAQANRIARQASASLSTGTNEVLACQPPPPPTTTGE